MVQFAHGILVALLVSALPVVAIGPSVALDGVPALQDPARGPGSPLPPDPGTAEDLQGAAAEALDGAYSEAVAVYAEVASEAERYFRNVRPPEDPSQPQDGGVSTLDVSPAAFEAIEDTLPALAAEPDPGGHAAVQAAPIWSEAPAAAALEASPVPQQERREADDAPPEPEAASGARPTSGEPSAATVAGEAPSAARLVVATAVAVAAVAVLHFAAPGAQRLVSLLRKAGLTALAPQITRIKSHQALQDPKRRLLYRLISTNPGISMKELCDASQMSRSAVEHHLTVVARAKLVVSESYGHGRHYFPAAEYNDRSQRLAYARRRQMHGTEKPHP